VLVHSAMAMHTATPNVLVWSRYIGGRTAKTSSDCGCFHMWRLATMWFITFGGGGAGSYLKWKDNERASLGR
jgi:hypothetical protein